jgi:hypothetical protein
LRRETKRGKLPERLSTASPAREARSFPHARECRLWPLEQEEIRVDPALPDDIVARSRLVAAWCALDRALEDFTNKSLVAA